MGLKIGFVKISNGVGSKAAYASKRCWEDDSMCWEDDGIALWNSIIDNISLVYNRFLAKILVAKLFLNTQRYIKS